MTTTLVEAPPTATLPAAPAVDECPAGGAHCWVRITGERSVGIPDHVRCDECGEQPTAESDDTYAASWSGRFASVDEAGW